MTVEGIAARQIVKHLWTYRY